MLRSTTMPSGVAMGIIISFTPILGRWNRWETYKRWDDFQRRAWVGMGIGIGTPLPDGLTLAGVVLSDQVKCADWEARNAEHVGTAPAELLAEVRAKLKSLLGT